MRGHDSTGGSLFSCIDLGARVPVDHPLRVMRGIVNAALVKPDASFEKPCKEGGRPSIAPERLPRATLLQMLHAIRPERQLVERLGFDLLFRWFAGLGIDDGVFVASVFSKNRDRLPTTGIAQEFLAVLPGLPGVGKLLGAEHFSVGGTMPKACASMKGFRPRGSFGEVSGMVRTNRPLPR